jgi:hypothetical protein
MARQQKTERQRAEEALAVAHRKVERLVAAEKHQAELLDLTRTELDDARRLLQYRQQHPALPRDSSTATASSITTTPKETTTP